MTRYAEGTTVPVTQSQSEIANLLKRFGADGFQLGWQSRLAAVGFRYNGRVVRFVLELPDPEDPEFWYTPQRNTKRTPQQAQKALAQEERRRWRALTLAIKAKLETVSTGIASFEDEFLAYTVLPDGSTVAQRIQDQVDAATQGGSTLLQLGPGEQSGGERD